MDKNKLWPSIDLLKQEYLLVQAWKKTASYIRYHNWYADTLELDRAAVNLPKFLEDLAERFASHEDWISDPLRIVPAPKSQEWQVDGVTGKWGPVDSEKIAEKLRPLAHVTLRDQVAATAIMLCLADRVESAQGDPRPHVGTSKQRKRVISYGNRLFCDGDNHLLTHRWGSTKLYRSYFQDYRKFLTRPEVVAENAELPNKKGIVVVHSDLRQFYDRVQPDLLASKLATLALSGAETEFFTLVRRMFNWRWYEKDEKEVQGYASQADLPGFANVALPQGLVAAGFFANVALLDFDKAILASFHTSIAPDMELLDVSRYVDDLRIVLAVPEDYSLTEIENHAVKWLQGLLDVHAQGGKVSPDKTEAARFRGDERPLNLQSRKMERIKTAVSGGFDAIGGERILEAVQGLIRSQQRYSDERQKSRGWKFSPIPDVRDTTVTRFAAARFRTTYRSLRPLLEESRGGGWGEESDESCQPRGLSRVVRTQEDLDDEARTFALGLIENWVEDPSNVRLLRIGLDLWPAADVLCSVLDLLRPVIQKDSLNKAHQRVAWYCMAEILRAGATETGFVEYAECFPEGVDIKAYRRVLLRETVRLLQFKSLPMPWYVEQQALLYLAVNGPSQVPLSSREKCKETVNYSELIRYLQGEVDDISELDITTLSVLCRRSFHGREKAVQLASVCVTPSVIEGIAQRDPSFALEMLEDHPSLSEKVSPRLRDDLSLDLRSVNKDVESLAAIVLKGGPRNPLRNEHMLLEFASKFLSELADMDGVEVIAPSNVMLMLNVKTRKVDGIKIKKSRVSPAGSMYRPPLWCDEAERWRFQLGYLIRFILSARADFTSLVRPVSWKEGAAIYRAPESHWYQRLYGMFNGHSAFGDDWLPISGWTENLLIALLGWPGCLEPEMTEVQLGPEVTRNHIEAKLRDLLEEYGSAGSVLMLRLPAPRPDGLLVDRPLRACVVQTVLPMPSEKGDFPEPEHVTIDALKFNDPAIRRRHQNHLSTALAAVERMLDLRETHKGQDGRLDWLILPELSVHPDDVKTHLIPFVRTHKTIILAGITYQELFAGKPLVNSALWIIPKWTSAHGLQVKTVRQGKKHLSPEEKKYNTSTKMLQGFRPCQWLVGYDWSGRTENNPLWLSAAICYDATDLSLAADLRNKSDVFAISSLNKDVKTFDQMALALHYHMFQLVIVANNGWYGGSNAYTPYREDFVRQVFHLHGQPQASIGFLEIDDIEAYLRRRADSKNHKSTSKSSSAMPRWKFPPAGM